MSRPVLSANNAIRPVPTRPLLNYVHGPKAVGSFVPKLAKKSFEKFGFAAAAVLTDWQQIVGPDIAAYTAPERLRWPKPVDGESRDNSRAGPRAGATLTLRVAPARALDIQYKTQQIVERINAYFGYRAVTDIRLVQAPLATSARTPAPGRTAASHPGAKAAIKAMLDKADTTRIDDVDLRSALERMGAGIGMARQQRG